MSDRRPRSKGRKTESLFPIVTVILDSFILSPQHDQKVNIVFPTVAVAYQINYENSSILQFLAIHYLYHDPGFGPCIFSFGLSVSV